MKSTVFILFSAVLLVGCFVTKPRYPSQSETGRKDVPKVLTFIDKLPIVEQIGDVKIIHDVRNNGFIFFKGEDDSVLNKLKSHLSTPVKVKDSQTGSEVQLNPVGAFIMTTIPAHTLFSGSELRKMRARDRSRIVELARYKGFGITLQDYTYVELLHPDELAVLYDRPVQQTGQSVVTKPNTNQQSNQPINTSPQNTRRTPYTELLRKMQNPSN